jgi:O-acetylserine/cysteine efflux transporter
VPPTRLTGRDFAGVLCIVLVWGSVFVAMKIALEGFTPLQLGAARYVVGVLPLVFFVAPPRLHWKWVLIYGLVQGVGQFGLLFISLRVGMSAALASVLMQTHIFFTAFFSLLVLAEKPGKPLVWGMLLAAAGLVCFGLNYAGPWAGAAGGTTLAGFALCLGAASMWGASNIIVRLAQRETPRFDTFGFVVWSSVVPIVPFVLLSLLLDPPEAKLAWLNASALSWLAVAYIGWAAAILAFTLWNGLIRRHGANRIAPFSLGMPIVGLTTGMLLLGERITTLQWAGIALTLAALGVVLSGSRR